MSSLLIRNGLVVTLNDRNDVLPGGSVYIEDAKIVEVGFIDSKYRPASGRRVRLRSCPA